MKRPALIITDHRDRCSGEKAAAEIWAEAMKWVCVVCWPRPPPPTPPKKPGLPAQK